MRETSIVGCVLAGGLSTRMGTDKALLTLDNVTLIERAVTLLKSVFPSVVISSDRRDAHGFLGVPVIPDIKKECGPLGGIHATLVQTNADHLFVLACDMPFVSKELILYIIKSNVRGDAVVPSMEGRIHPLCGVYAQTGLPTMEDFLAKGMYTLQRVLEKLNPTVVPLTPDLPFFTSRLLDNVNDADDFVRATSRTNH